MVFGALSALGLPLAMASIAVLPVLFGLAVDYATQLPAGGARAVPAIATAALATAVGFLILLLSPVPMVRGFGALLVAGVGVALVLVLTAGRRCRPHRSPHGPPTGRSRAPARRRWAGRRDAAAARGARSRRAGGSGGARWRSRSAIPAGC